MVSATSELLRVLCGEWLLLFNAKLAPEWQLPNQPKIKDAWSPGSTYPRNRSCTKMPQPQGNTLARHVPGLLTLALRLAPQAQARWLARGRCDRRARNCRFQQRGSRLGRFVEVEIQIKLWNRLGVEGHRFANRPGRFLGRGSRGDRGARGLSKLIFGGSLSERDVLTSTTSEVGASEMSSSSVKSSGVPLRGSGLTSGGTENTCVSLAG